MSNLTCLLITIPYPSFKAATVKLSPYRIRHTLADRTIASSAGGCQIGSVSGLTRHISSPVKDIHQDQERDPNARGAPSLDCDQELNKRRQPKCARFYVEGTEER